MTKYQQVISELFSNHKQKLEDFSKIHDLYEKDQNKWQAEYNLKGAIIMETLHFYERQLCGKQERSGMGVYSSKLADKYWQQIKKKFPLIDFVGVVVK